MTYDNSSLGWDGLLQRVEIVANIGLYQYTITTTNYSDGPERVTNSNKFYNDHLSISIRQKGKKEADQITFVDYGLDGNVDYMGPYALLPFEKPVTLFGYTLPADTRYVPRDDRPRIDPQLDKKEVADALYNTALNRIIAFYERNK